MFDCTRILLISGVFGSGYDRKVQAMFHFNSARDYFDKKEYEKSIEMYSKAFEIDPTNSTAMVECADAYYLLADFQKSKECLLRAIKIKKNDPKAHCNLGNIYIFEGDKKNAKREYKRALLSNPFYQQAWYNLIHFNTLAGDLYDNLGVELQKRSEYLKALPFHEKAIEYGTTYPAITHNNLGYAYENLNDFEKAVFYYDKAIEIDPNYSRARNNRDSAYKKMNR